MAKAYKYKFVVKGRGRFPLDMLRYDCCYPTGEFYPGKNNEESRLVEMAAIFPKNWSPTDQRWRSFGWMVTSHFKCEVNW